MKRISANPAVLLPALVLAESFRSPTNYHPFLEGVGELKRREAKLLSSP